jgi:hypothetical protein
VGLASPQPTATHRDGYAVSTPNPRDSRSHAASPAVGQRTPQKQQIAQKLHENERFSSRSNPKTIRSIPKTIRLAPKTTSPKAKSIPPTPKPTRINARATPSNDKSTPHNPRNGQWNA